MKRIVLIVGLSLIVITSSKTNLRISNNRNNCESMLVDFKELRFKQLVHSLILVESNNGRFLHDTLNHDAIGILQIRPVLVDEVNRFVGHNKYQYDDRWDSIKSIEMFRLYQNKYNPHYDFERGCRIWNGGPTGHKKLSTLSYLDKALIQLEIVINNF